jgi:hypothetical protein
MTDYRAHTDEYDRQDRRLVILRLLNEDTDKTIRDRTLQIALQQLGHNESLDVIRADMAWLKSVGAISVATPHPDIYIASLERPGRDHIELKTPIPGILKPSKAVSG